MEISPAVRRYAAEIYRLQQDHPFASLSMIAEHVYASPQAVSRMIARMKGAQLLEHTLYKGVRLTPDGEQTALPAIRRHRLAEVFLVKVMGFGWDEVHELSDKFEAGVNQVLEDRMDALSGYPARCPHGDPIPSKDGEMPLLSDRSLVSLEPEVLGHVSRVRTHDGQKLRYLEELGLVPGTGFRIVARAPFNGPFRIRVEDQEHVLGFELARVIWVETLEGEVDPSLCDRSGCPLPKSRFGTNQ